MQQLHAYGYPCGRTSHVAEGGGCSPTRLGQNHDISGENYYRVTR